MIDRYDTSGNPEAQYQPNSDNTVLLNKLGIIDSDKMDTIEYDLLEKAQEELFDVIDIDQVITSSDLCSWHQRWLESVYE